MSVVAWDGHILAADRQVTFGDTKFTTEKIFQLSNGHVLAFVGLLSRCAAMKKWYETGADPSKYPVFKETKDDDSCETLVIATPDDIYYTEDGPDRIPVLDPIRAWGSGKEAALGAMEMGADARRAVEVACKWNAFCGNGVTFFQVRP